MLDAIINFLKALFTIYNSLPDEHKDTIKKKCGEAFDPVFRDFYRSETEGAN